LVRRLFRTAGRFYELEVSVLAALNLDRSLREVIAEFAASKRANDAWIELRPTSPLRVFLLPSRIAPALVSKYKGLILPSAFARLQELFQGFYAKLAELKGCHLRWIYEDNLVNVKLVSDRYNLLLRLPLVFAVIIAAVFDYGGGTYDFIAKKTGLSLREVECFIGKCTSKEFPLLVMTGHRTVSWNPAFRTPRRKISIDTNLFSLAPPKENTHFGAVANVATDATYRGAVVTILKRAKQIEEAALFQRVYNHIRRLSSFSKDDYDRSLIFLETSRYLRRDAARPSLLLYCTD
jgi:hypothetical protein